jgi:hypothetical protein
MPPPFVWRKVALALMDEFKPVEDAGAIAGIPDAKFSPERKGWFKGSLVKKNHPWNKKDTHKQRCAVLQLGHTSRHQASEHTICSMSAYTACTSTTPPKIQLGSRKLREGMFVGYTDAIAGNGQEATDPLVTAMRDERQTAAASAIAAATATAAAAEPTGTNATTPLVAAPAFAQIAGLGGASAPVGDWIPRIFNSRDHRLPPLEPKRKRAAKEEKKEPARPRKKGKSRALAPQRKVDYIDESASE